MGKDELKELVKKLVERVERLENNMLTDEDLISSDEHLSKIEDELYKLKTNIPICTSDSGPKMGDSLSNLGTLRIKNKKTKIFG